MTRKQAEEQAKLEDAVRWGMYEGEEPTPEQMRAAEKLDPAGPAAVDRKLRELFGRVAAQLDEQTRNDLHDFVVALACNGDIEQTGTWLFALMRAMKPIEESQDD